MTNALIAPAAFLAQVEAHLTADLARQYAATTDKWLFVLDSIVDPYRLDGQRLLARDATIELIEDRLLELLAPEPTAAELQAFVAEKIEGDEPLTLGDILGLALLADHAVKLEAPKAPKQLFHITYSLPNGEVYGELWSCHAGDRDWAAALWLKDILTPGVKLISCEWATTDYTKEPTITVGANLITPARAYEIERHYVCPMIHSASRRLGDWLNPIERQAMVAYIGSDDAALLTAWIEALAELCPVEDRTDRLADFRKLQAGHEAFVMAERRAERRQQSLVNRNEALKAYQDSRNAAQSRQVAA
jgi:hypothetical protein